MPKAIAFSSIHDQAQPTQATAQRGASAEFDELASLEG
jgi:hypothetical protein